MVIGWYLGANPVTMGLAFEQKKIIFLGSPNIFRIKT
jgi:hypothetical protein